MPYTTLALGLTLTIPTVGTRNWGTLMLSTTWTKVSQHTHTGAGDGNKIGTAALENNAVTKTQLSANLALTQAATLIPAGNQAINFNLGNVQKIDLGVAAGDITVTTANEIEGGHYKLFIIQGAVARAITWPANFKWVSGTAPVISIVNDAIDKIELYYDGTNFYCDFNLAYS